MDNFNELVKMLRVCGDSNNSCGNCPILEDGSCPHGEWEFAAEKYMLQAADAIEYLVRKLGARETTLTSVVGRLGDSTTATADVLDTTEDLIT